MLGSPTGWNLFWLKHEGEKKVNLVDRGIKIGKKALLENLHNFLGFLVFFNKGVGLFEWLSCPGLVWRNTEK